jgi:CarD family transcriptional regulator
MATNKKMQKTKPAVKAKAAPKASPKAVKKPSTPLKTNKKAPVKAAKPVAKTVAKKAAAPAKVPVKAKAKPAPTKLAVKAKPVAKPVAKTAAKAPAKVAIAPKSAPVAVKTPINQNAKPAVILQKTADGLKALSPNSASVTKPVYRPIQVINKPLAPLQPVRQMAPISAAAEKIEYKKGDYVVYPAHGVGQIEAVETQTIGGMEIKLYAIQFEKDRMRLKVPVFKAHASGLRRLSSTNRMQDALKTLQGRAQIRRAMWSRRAQEYEMKINSGDPVSIAEVLRDLKRSNDDTEQSYSERQIYQSALERLAREVAAVEKITEVEAAERLENMIKGRRPRNATDKPADDTKEVAVA